MKPKRDSSFKMDLGTDPILIQDVDHHKNWPPALQKNIKVLKKMKIQVVSFFVGYYCLPDPEWKKCFKTKIHRIDTIMQASKRE
jgi:hypothetical protein